MSKTIAGVVIVTAALASGCYQKHLILQAEVVSMTKTDAQGVKALKMAGDVNEKWCMGDELALKTGTDEDKDVGLADQVIYKAQGGGKAADFITDVRIFGDTDGCALLEGKRASL